MANRMKPIRLDQQQQESVVAVLTKVGLPAEEGDTFISSILNVESYDDSYNTFEWTERGAGTRFLVTPRLSGEVEIEVVRHGSFTIPAEDIFEANSALRAIL